MNILALLVFSVVTWGTAGEPHRLTKRAVKCPEKYKKLTKHTGELHVMCKYKRRGKKLKTTKADIKTILDEHNKYRLDPKMGVTAKAMCKLYWDDRLAEIAQAYAETCRHWEPKDKDYADTQESGAVFTIPGYNSDVSPNMFFGAGPKQGWKAGIKLWYDEHKNFGYMRGEKNYSDWADHFTTMMLDDMCRVGCGTALCDYPGKKDLPVDVCMYSGFLASGRFMKPFESGKPCSGCPGRCVDGKLCDTKGMLCYNEGWINFENNTCYCLPQYTGKYCENMLCYGDHKDCKKECKAVMDKNDHRRKKHKHHYGKAWSKTKGQNCCEETHLRMHCPVMCEMCTKKCKAGKMYFKVPKAEVKDNTGKVVAKYPGGKVTALKGYEKCQERTKAPFNSIIDVLSPGWLPRMDRPTQAVPIKFIGGPPPKKYRKKIGKKKGKEKGKDKGKKKGKKKGKEKGKGKGKKKGK